MLDAVSPPFFVYKIIHTRMDAFSKINYCSNSQDEQKLLPC